jgi:hypothetical protein
LTGIDIADALKRDRKVIDGGTARSQAVEQTKSTLS